MLEMAITTYFQQQQAVVEDNWQLAKAHQDMEAIHDLRLGIKRIRTLYQFLDAISNGIFDYKLHFEELKLLFKAAGHLRDLQVQSHLFSDCQEQYPKKDFIAFYQYLQHQHDQESKAFEAALYRFQPEGLNDSLKDAQLFLQSLETDKIWEGAFNLLEKRLKQASKLRQKVDKKSKKAHEMRSRFKQVGYLHELTQLFYEEEQQLLKGRKRLKKISKQLGGWHDKEVLLEQLYRFCDMSARPEVKPYKKLIRQLEKEVKSDLGKALEQIDAKAIQIIRPEKGETLGLNGTLS